MRRIGAGVAIALALVAVGCGDDGGGTAPAVTTTTSVDDRVPVCARAQDTVGVADPPTDLVLLAADAGRIADLATAPDEPLRSALEPVSDAAADLSEAARAGDEAAIADAAATLTAAYDELDLVAASMEAAECTSESWGRQVAIAAIDLVGAGG
jgi:hypothetical protein